MKKIRNFKCSECETITEKFVNDSVKAIKCECNGKAVRIISAARYFSNTVGKSPSAR